MKTLRWSLVVVFASVLVIGGSVARAQGEDLIVSDVFAIQIPGPGIVFVMYKLETIDDVPVTISLFLSTDGGASYPFLCRTVTGDVGAGVRPGEMRFLIWNAGVDIPGVVGDDYTVRVTADDGVPEDFVALSPGLFTMGSPTNEPGRQPNEIQHQVILTRGFFVKRTEVTNQQYMELAQWAFDHGYVTADSSSLYDNLDGSTQSLKLLGADVYEIYFDGGIFRCINPAHPVRYMNWYGSVSYCDWLSLRDGLPRAYNHDTWQCNDGDPYAAAGYRLPTEAEWEFACRAGSTTAFANGPITHILCDPLDPNLDQMGWYCGNASEAHPVAQKLSNAWGLYDMHGNVWEWCNDWYGEYDDVVTDPVGPWDGDRRMSRGGTFANNARFDRSAYRGYTYPSAANFNFGFRPVRSGH